MQQPLRTLHLFAGAGGGILGDILLGHQPICAVEIEPYCQQVLHARQQDGLLPWFPIFEDVKTFDGRPWRGIADVVCGGFPCQDISAAGTGKGIEGSRSGLWGQMVRVVREVRPRFVFVENSPNLVVRGLGRILEDLAALGFDAAWGVYGASDLNAPHIRKRIWILADSNSNGLDPLQDETPCPRKEPCEQQIQGTWGRAGEFFPAGTIGGASRGIPTSDAWGVAYGLPDGVDRLKAIGNGQVPLCAAYAWKILSRMA
jgi:DNA (cytosine-5)-methyltransferase 1